MVRWPVQTPPLAWAVVVLTLTPLTTRAGFVTATLTADNHYALYTGQRDGTGLALVGRNEVGLWGSNGGYNWSDPETYNVAVTPGAYLYVVGWDDYGPQMWVGQFRLPDGTYLYSNAADWEYAYGPAGASPGAFGDAPGVPVLSSVIQAASWAAPQVSAPQGSYPWSPVPGISPSASYVWSDTFGVNGPEDDRYVIFRTRAPVEPVPGPPGATLAVIGILSVAGGWWFRRV